MVQSLRHCFFYEPGGQINCPIANQHTRDLETNGSDIHLGHCKRGETLVTLYRLDIGNEPGLPMTDNQDTPATSVHGQSAGLQSTNVPRIDRKEHVHSTLTVYWSQPVHAPTEIKSLILLVAFLALFRHEQNWQVFGSQESLGLNGVLLQLSLVRCVPIKYTPKDTERILSAIVHQSTMRPPQAAYSRQHSHAGGVTRQILQTGDIDSNDLLEAAHKLHDIHLPISLEWKR
jgi:hypothetical protein